MKWGVNGSSFSTLYNCSGIVDSCILLVWGELGYAEISYSAIDMLLEGAFWQAGYHSNLEGYSINFKESEECKYVREK